MTNLKFDADKTGSLGGREAALQAVHGALRGHRFVSDTLGELRRQGRLEGREAALATEVALGAVRHVHTIASVLGRVAEFDQRRVKAELRAVLYTAAYQLIWLDRIPEFAAVDEAVSLARRMVGARGAGMVNAILRNMTRAIERHRVPWQRLDPGQIRVSWDQACAFKLDVLPAPDDEDGSLAHMAAATGEQLDRYAALVERFGVRAAEQTAWAAQAVPAIALHRNILRINPAVFQTRVREEYGRAVEWSPDVAFLPASANVVDTLLFREGRVYVQDVTAHAAALLVGARPGESVLDFCAAPGGKSVVLAQQMDDRGEVVAVDASPERILRVRDNATRLRLTSIRTHLIQTSDASEPPLARRFDAVLVDVPCSNSGVIARRPEARLGLTPEKLASLVKLQTALLRRAAKTVRGGGRLVYSTCSIEPEENEQVVEAFVQESPQWDLGRAETTLPQWGPHLSDWHDGGFAASLQRSG